MSTHSNDSGYESSAHVSLVENTLPQPGADMAHASASPSCSRAHDHATATTLVPIDSSTADTRKPVLQGQARSEAADVRVASMQLMPPAVGSTSPACTTKLRQISHAEVVLEEVISGPAGFQTSHTRPQSVFSDGEVDAVRNLLCSTTTPHCFTFSCMLKSVFAAVSSSCVHANKSQLCCSIRSLVGKSRAAVPCNGMSGSVYHNATISSTLTSFANLGRKCFDRYLFVLLAE